NFLYLTRRLLGLETSRASVGVRSRPGEVEMDGRKVRVGAFPISIDSASLDALARSAASRRRAAEMRRELGNPRRVILGVDRLDYTKGIELRLRALHELYTDGRITCEDTVMVQLATPSRERVEHYQRMRSAIERQVGRINGEFGRVGRPAVHY